MGRAAASREHKLELIRRENRELLNFIRSQAKPDDQMKKILSVLDRDQGHQGLDPVIASAIRFLRGEWVTIFGIQPPRENDRHLRARDRVHLTWSVPDGNGGSKRYRHVPNPQADEKRDQQLDRVVEDLKAGREDELGLYKFIPGNKSSRPSRRKRKSSKTGADD
ncbi:hypothetical protein [Rhizobium grahamii]|uniref:Uncharacterized protein n=1 Tax=Rhizobium grahamii CCGE 502 TaxID=990285 RepID=S3HZH8_9HYPH|nr:hypothetical protein [Rhizobium grahamii]EPE98426.1 hypothetical protein RGCCGE502_08365 [Rhizobium grahamii CCGE 502]